jgi:hypothetical protein
MASQSQRIIKQDMKILIEPSVPSGIIPKVKKISPSPTHSSLHYQGNFGTRNFIFHLSREEKRIISNNLSNETLQ